MTRLIYPVKEVFLTLQGEGVYAGHRAVFLRFAGCNVWSGRDKDRERDTAKGCCAAWCDTDFVGTNGTNGGSYSGANLADLVRLTWGDVHGPMRVVCTGGEPGLVLDDVLVKHLHDRGFYVHCETNGSLKLPDTLDWVTLSPKPPMRVVPQRFHEVKVVLPAVNPGPYEAFAAQRFVQPMDSRDPAENAKNLQHCIDYVMGNPEWRLGLQSHKIVGVP